MQCPVCDERMREVEKHGVTVDICPGCKGVWLDRGELERIVEMYSGDAPLAPGGQTSPPAREAEMRMPATDGYAPRRQHDDDDEDDDEGRRDRPLGRRAADRGEEQYHRRRRGGILGDLLDALGGGGED